MKKLILLFSLLLCITAFPQKTFYQYLQNSYDSTTAANYDTLTVFNLGRAYESATLIIENVTASTPCTLSVKGGSFVRNSSEWTMKSPPAVTDTNYYVIPVNSNAGTNTTSFIVAGASAVMFDLKKPYLELVQVYITQNAGGQVKCFVETGEPIKK